jgi:hypothetical protein
MESLMLGFLVKIDLIQTLYFYLILSMKSLHNCFFVLVLFLGFLPLTGCQAIYNIATEPCFQKDYWKLRGLSVGSSVSMKLGRGQIIGSDCLDQPQSAKDWTWSTSDSTVATVSSIGVVTGHKPGTFSLTAMSSGKVLTKEGYIMPKDWTIELKLSASKIKVGQSVELQVIAYDSNRQKLPFVPFSIYIPEFSDKHKGNRHLTNQTRTYQSSGTVAFLTTTPTALEAIAPGTVEIVGEIDRKQVKTTLTITP